MRTLVLSDVHGNNVALQAVLDHAYRYHTPDEVWFLGDLVGYGPDPLAVWQALHSEPIPAGCWLAGNHDWGLVNKLHGPTTFFTNGNEQSGAFEISNFRQVAWAILQWQQKVLVDYHALYEQLTALPVVSCPRPGVYLAHGAFADEARASVTRYVPYPTLSPAGMVTNIANLATTQPECVFLRANGNNSQPRLFIFGHTHRPGIWHWQPEHEQWQTCPLTKRYTITNDFLPYCVNPGSVGFPRDGIGCPSYLVIDWQEKYLQLFRVPYDVASVRRRMAQHPYEMLLGENGFLIEPGC